MAKLGRILTVTGALAGIGAVTGAVAGTVVAFLVIVLKQGLGDALDLQLFEIGAWFGAPLGATLFPLAGWLLMRRVPIGRALLGTMLGTIVGGLVGWFAPIRGAGDIVDHTLLCGLIGFSLAVLLLRRTSVKAEIAPEPIV
ncbi:MAG TPA: hypothetical protein VGJ18_24190 [Gemmatimonadaceae bacterium]|jgi:hypothetical protein